MVSSDRPHLRILTMYMMYELKMSKNDHSPDILLDNSVNKPSFKGCTLTPGGGLNMAYKYNAAESLVKTSHLGYFLTSVYGQNYQAKRSESPHFHLIHSKYP